MKIAIRTDANNQIGSGHTMRCVALAEELRGAGYETIFLTRDEPGNLNGLIEDHWGFEVRPVRGTTPLPDLLVGPDRAQADDAHDTALAIGVDRVDWIFVDHYSLDATWETRVQPLTTHLAVIDDLANRSHDCDILIDHNLLPGERYRALVPEACSLLLGPRYALLRREFRGVAQHRDHPEDVQRILVSFGGSDPTDQTSASLDAILSMPAPYPIIDVIAGPNHPNIASLEARANQTPDVIVHRGVRDMAPLLERADVAIGAGGVSALERLCVALPSIVIAIADNQHRIAEALSQQGAIEYLGLAADVTRVRVQDALEKMRDRAKREKIASLGTKLVDGYGTRRAANAIANSAPLPPNSESHT